MTGLKPAILALVLLLSAGTALGATALGPRLGLVEEGDEFFLGVQGEFGPAFGPAILAPSLDFRIGDGPPTILNVDLRLYPVLLPETGVRVYGALGPSWQFSQDDELGLSLAAGLHIPMKGLRRYNLEYRWGSGGIPESKIALAVLFGI